jgi:hypothetical protein
VRQQLVQLLEEEPVERDAGLQQPHECRARQAGDIAPGGWFGESSLLDGRQLDEAVDDAHPVGHRPALLDHVAAGVEGALGEFLGNLRDFGGLQRPAPGRGQDEGFPVRRIPAGLSAG